MRLIRLTGEDPEGILSNDFQQDIIITPQSKIALKSMSIEVQLSQLEVSSANDTINFQVQTSQGILTSQLKHASYDNITAPTLFADMDLKMNAQLRTVGANVGRNIGLEIKNEVRGNDSKFQTVMKQGNLNENTDSLVLDKGSINVTRSETGIYTASAIPSAVTPFDSFFYDPNPIARGGGMVRFKINRMGNTTDNFIIGLTSTNPDTISANTFDESLLDYAIIGLQSTQNYGVYVNGASGIPVSSVTPNIQGVGSTLNDDLVISIDQGKVVGYIYQDGTGTSPGANLVFQEDYNFPNKLYPVVIMLGQSNHSSVRLFRYTQSPFNTTFTGQVLQEDLAEGKLQAPPQQNKSPTNHFLEFEGNSLAEFLGFDNTRTPATPNTFEFTNNFIADGDNKFQPNNLSDAFLVEMLNLQLKSYDGLTGQRKSYLTVIPQTDRDGIVIYDASYPIFIDLENTQALSIRNLRARILNNDGSSISMRGLASLVLLIEDGEKKQFKLTE